MDSEETTQLIEQYLDGYRVVLESLEGITEDELDRTADHGWTSRQIVHHLADAKRSPS